MRTMRNTEMNCTIVSVFCLEWLSWSTLRTRRWSPSKVWWPHLAEEAGKTLTKIMWLGWSCRVQKQKAPGLCLGVLLCLLPKTELYLPQVIFCKVLPRKKKKKEQLENTSSITKQISSEHPSHLSENLEKT